MFTNSFLMIDLDGTLIDSDPAHFEAYKKTFAQFGKELTWKEFEETIHVTSFEDLYKKKGFSESDFKMLKQIKKEYFKQTETVFFIPGAEKFLQKCLAKNVNFVIVTNTGKEVIEFIKSKQPLLHKCKIIVREDYKEPKPNPECYKKAKELYWKGEKGIIGFENTVNGYKALKEVSDIQYFIKKNIEPSQNKSTIIISDFMNLLQEL